MPKGGRPASPKSVHNPSKHVSAGAGNAGAAVAGKSSNAAAPIVGAGAGFAGAAAAASMSTNAASTVPRAAAVATSSSTTVPYAIGFLASSAAPAMSVIFTNPLEVAKARGWGGPPLRHWGGVAWAHCGGRPARRATSARPATSFPTPPFRSPEHCSALLEGSIGNLCPVTGVWCLPCPAPCSALSPRFALPPPSHGLPKGSAPLPPAAPIASRFHTIVLVRLLT